MRRTKAEIFLHFVWATYERLPLVSLEAETPLYACIIAEAERLGAEVLATGGMPDHVHLVVRKPPTVSESQLMQRVKGVSSTLARQHLLGKEAFFRWQANYGVFSFHKKQVVYVVRYVQNQKVHHQDEETRAEWEATDEEHAPA